MRKTVCLTLLAFGLLVTKIPAGQAEETAVSVEAGSPNPDVLFEVKRNGKPVGRHSITFRGDEADMSVEVRFEIAIPILFFATYEYLYKSSARWQDGELISLQATTDDDGDVTNVVAVSQGDAIMVTGPEGEVSVGRPLFPTNHWNPDVLGQDRVLNTITGEIDQVSISEVGVEEISTERGTIEATRYAYGGDLMTEVLYDAERNWVGMEFEAKDGSTISYRCLRCQGGVAVTATQ